MPRASFRIDPFSSEWIASASALVARQVAELRDQITLIPARWADSAAYVDRLTSLVEKGPAVVAVDHDELVGFMTAMQFEWSQGRWAYSPEWANLATGPAARRIRHDMYASLAERWVADDRRAHFVSLLPNDDVGREAMGWVGFGVTNVDGLRNLDPVLEAPALDVTMATPADLVAVATLEQGLRDHLASTPLFLRYPELDRLELTDVLAEPKTATLLATDDDGPLAFLRIGPHSTDASTIIRDEGTASITRAFTRADRRGGGVARALLDAALTWARDNGYLRCSVDFESANLLATGFWTAHFQTAGITVGRRL